MIGFVSFLFDTSDFPARWNCGNWSSVHGWVHILSDIAIASAYAMIPLAITGYCWVKRSELAFPKVLWLFAAFIFSCGSAHLVEAIIFYFPIYHFAALLKVITAVVSWATVIAIIRIAPTALELPGLRRVNQQLQEQLVISNDAWNTVERCNRELEAFTGIVTHDLKNPISGALFMAELAKESAETGDTRNASAQLEIVLASLQQMNQYVADLHTEAMMRETKPDMSKIELDEVLAAVHTKLAPLLESAGARLERQPMPRVMGNKVLLIQLFTNLIENAVKYRTHEAPVIRVESATTDRHEIIRLTDNGRGIPEGEEALIFEPRHRASNVQDAQGSGTGLYRCETIMKAHQGGIRVLTNDGGAIFELSFPTVGNPESVA